MHRTPSVFALVLPEPSFAVLDCISAHDVSKLPGVCTWQRQAYLEDFFLCGRDIPDERWSAYAEDCTSLEKLVCCLRVATNHVTYAEKALMYVRADGMVISCVSSLDARQLRVVRRVLANGGDVHSLQPKKW